MRPDGRAAIDCATPTITTSWSASFIRVCFDAALRRLSQSRGGAVDKLANSQLLPVGRSCDRVMDEVRDTFEKIPYFCPIGNRVDRSFFRNDYRSRTQHGICILKMKM
jgi:hypothetical protein